MIAPVMLRPRRLLLALALLLTSCATDRRPTVQAAAEAPADVTVDVVRNGATWTADYSFAAAASAWAFHRSARTSETRQSWRAGTWTVETPGVRLERRGRYDLLVGENGGVPSQVRLRFTPYSAGVETSYDPALEFTDGSVALFAGQFSLFPVPVPDAAAQLPRDTHEIPAANNKIRMRFRDVNGQVLHAGRRHSSVLLEDDSSYVVFGPARPIVTDAMSAIIDPALPEWLRSFLARSSPQMLARYAAQLGPAPGPKPTFMISWAGPTPGLISMSGSVLPGLVTMRFEGVGVLQERAELRNQARWFIAHEAAHFWLGQAVRYERSRDAWITEGGADLLAIRTVQALDPSYDARAELNKLVAECAQLTENRGVADAQERGEHRAYYACGAVFALVAEAQSGRPFSIFVRGLIDANRADGVLTRGEWLDALDRVSREPAIRTDVEALLDRGAPLPEPAIAALLRRAGIPHSIGEDGVPRLQ